MSWNELLLDLESYIERYRRALDEIANNEWCNSQESLDKIQEIAQATLDGEPTTADEYNSDEITELVRNYPNDMQLGDKVRTLVNMGDDIEYKWVSPDDPGDENTPERSQK